MISWLLRRLLRSPIGIIVLMGVLTLVWFRPDLLRQQAPPAPSGDDPAWREPTATLAPTPAAIRACRAVDGDTLHCAGTRVRLRGVDTPEREEPNYREATRALQAMVDACRTGLTLIPHHRSYDRIVGDVLCGGQNIGQAMHAAGWSKPAGARR